MTPQEALGIRGCAGAGCVSFTRHALARMGQRGAGKADVVNALANAASCVADGDKWKATGPDLDNDDLTAVVAIENGVVIVTVF